MREKELRLAVVLFGGISLAVYMHGVSKEFLKLVRASASLHGMRDRAQRANAQFEDGAGPDPGGEFDSEHVYFRLLQEIGRHIDLRVGVDIIAGASAGGINGVMLARALSHNLSFSALRDQWLVDADVTGLLVAEQRARPWSKMFMRPLLWFLERSRLLLPVADPEVREKLSLFVRSRWFRPPFDGRRMSGLMLDGALALRPLPGGPPSLLSTGQSLDLFVTLTDFHGYRRVVKIHDPPQIEEREHRHVLRFACHHWPGGGIASQFDDASVPALAFAARATSAFPGAFPPATLGEMDRLLEKRGLSWPGRAQFIEEGFAAYVAVGQNPERNAFIDGAVLNNKPFREAIRAIHGRPAYRQVERRLVYVDPDPVGMGNTHPPGVPSFLPVLKAALSDLPRNEPIGDELRRLAEANDQARLLRRIAVQARPHVARLVEDLVTDLDGQPLTPDLVRTRRSQANDRVARDAGLAYTGYVQLKLAATVEDVAHRLAAICGLRPASRGETLIVEAFEGWAASHGISYTPGAGRSDVETASHGAPAWQQFLMRFDINFRKRRLAFLIQGQNRLYEGLADGDEAGIARINELKREFYLCLDDLRRREDIETLDDALRDDIRALFAPLLASAAHRAMVFAADHEAAITSIVGRLGTANDMEMGSDMLDATLAGLDPAEWPAELRREVLLNYLGFPFWDLLTFSLSSRRDGGDFSEIRVDRVSPREARPFVDDAGLEGFGELKGIGLAHFAAFFSRTYREHDYLRGRLHAAVRLVDIVVDAAGPNLPSGAIYVDAVKRDVIRTILDAEEPHLPAMAAAIAAWRARLG